jgi:hypothetical protein
MAFTVSVIELVSEADELLRMAERDKRNLELRKSNITVRNQNAAEDVGERKAELAAAQAALAVSTTLLTTLPDGDTKDLEKIKNLELDARVRRLLRQGNKAGAVATLEQDYDVAQLTKQVEIAEAFIAEVKARKAAL